jgi:hypothetical protein
MGKVNIKGKAVGGGLWMVVGFAVFLVMDCSSLELYLLSMFMEKASIGKVTGLRQGKENGLLWCNVSDM